MPRVRVRPGSEKTGDAVAAEAAALMDLASARDLFGDRAQPGQPEERDESGAPALEQVKRYPRNVIIGIPGSGKSTLLEWLQLKVAAVEEALVLAGQQAIPLLLRVRELDVRNLPRGAALLEKATASKDLAALMPPGWVHRQMRGGRVLFMLDGLDETEPELRDACVIPWLLDLCHQYRDCRYLVSSRPVGYPPGTLRPLEFVESDLRDFGEPEIAEYTRHWCTAVRLARNEPAEEARREGANDGAQIVEGFKDNPYIRDLARNPLMLSAICLVNYFEGGQLPQDRALLYQLCVEGLLHHRDQRRGIHSVFSLEEKLRACREVALAMQASNLAEYGADQVQNSFTEVLADPQRAGELLRHIRYRTGLLLERRPGVFAFAHLTFQEYLAARAVHEGNGLGIDGAMLVREHDDARWQEVIALYCRLATAPAARQVIEGLIERLDTRSLAGVLGEAYLSAGPALLQDQALRQRVLKRVALAPAEFPPILGRFPVEEVAPIANQLVGKTKSGLMISEAFRWFQNHPELLDVPLLVERLREWRKMNSLQVAELVHLLHCYGPDAVLAEMATDAGMYAMLDEFSAGIACIGLGQRTADRLGSPGFDAAFLQVLRTLSRTGVGDEPFNLFIIRQSLQNILEPDSAKKYPADPTTWPEFVILARVLAERLAVVRGEGAAAVAIRARTSDILNRWADSLESMAATGSPAPGPRAGRRLSGRRSKDTAGGAP